MACSLRPSMYILHPRCKHHVNIASLISKRATNVCKVFPHEILGPNKDSTLMNKLQELNRLDKVVKIAGYKRTLCELCPHKFHDVVNSLDDSIIDELDYIRVMYKPSLETDQRISLRNKVSNIIKSRESEWSEHELMYFVWLLRYYRVF